MSRLPIPGSDDGDWGNILNDFLSKEHTDAGVLKIRSDGTLSGFETTTNKGANSGYAPLDGSAKVPVANLPDAALSGGFPDVGELNWQPLTLINNWRNYAAANPGDSPELWQDARYAKAGSMVIVQGILDGAAVGTAFPFAVMPTPLVPAKNRAAYLTGSTDVRVYIYGADSTTPGAIKPGGATAIPSFLLIDFIYFIN